jgi:hypothetical protein
MGAFAGHDSMTAAANPRRALRAIRVEGILGKQIDVMDYSMAKEIKPSLYA